MSSDGAIWRAARRVVPVRVRRWLQARRWLQTLWPTQYRPPVSQVSFGSLRRLTPISRQFGYDRGQPIDRYYIENFLNRQASDIQGRVLEIKDPFYTSKYGGSRVE